MYRYLNNANISAKQICKSVEGVEKKDLLREDFLLLCQTFHKVLDSDDYMDRLLDFVHLVVQVILHATIKLCALSCLQFLTYVQPQHFSVECLNRNFFYSKYSSILLFLALQTQRGDLRRERKRRRWLEVMQLLPKISGSDHALYFRSFFDIIEKVIFICSLHVPTLLYWGY